MTSSTGFAILRTLRISHPAISGSKNAETIHFYCDILGMELVLRQDNLDVPWEEHLFFHAGNDTFIAYFVPKDGAPVLPPAQSGSGHMDHLALDVDDENLERAIARLSQEGIAFEGPVDRGYERSIYFQDPNGATVELLAWITTPPAHIPQAQIIRHAQALREARGAAYIDDEDIRAAIAELSGRSAPAT
jgi:catechol 2,3-dioxygenase-like lactoylglutathione lyase family enzyme